MGSESDPSEDNLDEEEVYRDVYGLSNANYILEARFDAKQEFIKKIEELPEDKGVIGELLNKERAPPTLE